MNESLAGRVAVLELHPLSLGEMADAARPLETAAWNGGYPEPALQPEKRDLWLPSYLQTYVERGVRQLQAIRDLHGFELFLRLAAARHGQVFNTAALARECGVSLPTVKAWGGLLEASYLAFRLPPYFNNYGKRVTKTPKLYFLDSALVCALTRQPNGEAALAGPLGGVLFEGLLVSEAVKVLAARGKRPDLFYWRTQDGAEVDLILPVGGKLLPIEFKLTATPTLKHAGALSRFRRTAGSDAADQGLLVCRVQEPRALPNGNRALPWQQCSQ